MAAVHFAWKEADCARQVQQAVEVAGDNDERHLYPHTHSSFRYLRIESQSCRPRSLGHFYHVIIPKRCPNLNNWVRSPADEAWMITNYLMSSIRIADLGVIDPADRFKMGHVVWLTVGERLTTCVSAYKLREGKTARLTSSPRSRNSGRCKLISFKKRLYLCTKVRPSM